MVLKTQVLLSIIALLLSSVCYGQISFDSEEELEKAANDFFEAEDYAKAKPLFSQLLSKNALDPDFNYRFGVCIMFTEADPLKPLPYIEGGASSKGVNPEAFYYLGKAYQLNYRFDDAIKAYQTGKDVGFKSAKIDLDRSMQECRNGKILYNSTIEFQPAMDKEVLESEFYRPYDFRKLKGKVIPMPPNFKTKYDQKNLLGTVIYTPTNSEVLVYASYGEGGATAKDLYRVNRLPNGEWAIPQRLPDVINTRFDEDYAFFDEETQTLYFASKGHNTMGGYDVFSSKYDGASNSWSTPLNLQFPVNSPFDDFLYVSDPEGKVAFFTSGRNTEAGKLRVLKTLLHDTDQVEVSVVEGSFEDLTDSVYNYAALTVIDPISNEVVGKYRTNKISGKYLLILPPQNDYTMDVGPKDAHGFKFDLDVPKSEPFNPLQQRVEYRSVDERSTVSVTNYFDASGEPDTVSFVENRSLAEVTAQMTAMPKLTQEELALLNPKPANTEKQTQQQLAAAKEQAKQDSIQKAEQLAAKKQKEEAEAMAKAASERARQDSILQAEQQAVAREKARLDSIAVAENLALQKQQQEQTAREELARKEKMQTDSLNALKEEQLAAELRAQEALLAQETAAKERLLKETALQDSVKNAKAVDLKAQEAAAAVALLEAKRQEAVQDSLNALALAQKQAKEQAILDSLTRVEQQATLQAEREKRTADSLAEVARLAAIDREVELAKQQAMRDSMVVLETPTEPVSKEADAGTQTYADILKEMAAKEAEILGKQADVEEVPVSEETAAATTEEDEADVPLQSSELVEESDLYLQTIADLERQQQEQARLVEEENRQRELAKAEMLANAELQKREQQAMNRSQDGADSTALVDSATAVQPSAVSAETAQKEQALDGELESVALKSDADPNEYLKALAEMEAQMEKDAASRPDKDYSLRNMAELQPVQTEVSDPVLQAKIDADRKALAEHQQQARIKEEALKEQMQRDREMLSAYEGGLSDEMAAAELTMDGQDTTAQKPRKLADILAQKQDRVEAAEQVNEEIVAKELELVLEAENLLESQATAPSADDDLPADPEPEQAVQTTQTKEDNVAQEVEIIEEPAPVADVPEPVADQEKVAEPEVVAPVIEEQKPAEDQVLLDELAELDAIIADQSPVEVETPEETLPTATQTVEVIEPEIIEVADVEPTEPSIPEPKDVMDVSAPREAAVGSVGTIPFLTAAKRDYAKQKPSFDSIQDPGMRRMVKRMRAEDVGRLAVLKNMKNEWVQAGRTQEALSEIKANERNKDVLANLPEKGREEYVRTPFNTDDLRQRENVFYKLQLVLEPASVSETVAAAMSPQSAITFAMPVVNITSGYYVTLADVRADLKDYRNRGIDNVRIVPFLNGNEVLLSDVQGVPFVD